MTPEVDLWAPRTWSHTHELMNTCASAHACAHAHPPHTHTKRDRELSLIIVSSRVILSRQGCYSEFRSLIHSTHLTLVENQWQKCGGDR